MIVFVNGAFVPEEQAVVSVFDRGFLLGDGLFETLRVRGGVPFRWAQHLERLERGAAQLRLPLPISAGRLRETAAELVQRNQMPDAVLRLTISRGRGPRGYSIAGAGPSTVVMALQPAPASPAAIAPGWRLKTSSLRVVAGNPLAAVKTCSKATHIAARTEAEAGGLDEALLLNSAGQLAETTAANVFWIQRGTVCTPPLSAGILPGITRALVLELCGALGLPVAEENGTVATLLAAEGAFLTLSTWGLVEVCELDGQPIPGSPVVGPLQAAYAQRFAAETSAG